VLAFEWTAARYLNRDLHGRTLASLLLVQVRAEGSVG
jgi:hypothetical protein